MFVQQHWQTLLRYTRQSSLSQTTPVNRPVGRALQRARMPGELVPLQARSRSANRYLLQTDIARFYPSIYTHSIPWAMYGKAYAKRNRRGNIGNDLDALVRNAQSQQTSGTPIGPDTSLLIAELVLSATDQEFVSRLGQVSGFRSMDDYELCFASRAEAEEALAALEEVLSHYEFSPNPAKTRIVDLPQPIQARWVGELSTYRFRRGQVAQGTDILRFFDRAFLASKETLTSQ